MFNSCTSLGSIELPAGLLTIGEYAFANCSGLKSITVPEKVTAINGRVFINCTGLKEVNLPEGLTTIYAYAFENCQFEEIHIPDTVTTISARAFYNCKKLSEVNFPLSLKTVLNWDNYVADYNIHSPFDGCTSLKEMTVPEGVTAIPAHMFRMQSGLEKVKLPESLTYIGSYAFDGCSTLKTLELPSGITEIPAYAFRNCTSLETVEFNEGLQTIGSYAFYGCKSLEFFEAPTTLLTISQYAFAECLGLRMLYFNDNLTSLAAYAFAGCDGLVSVLFNDNLTVLSNKTFTDCANLTAAEIPATVTSYGVDCFYNCPKLIIYCYTDSAAHKALENSSYTYYLLDGHTHTFREYIETEATCFRKGAKILTCTEEACLYNHMELIERLGHSYEKTIVEADCTNYGCTLYICSECGDFYEEDITEAKGHTRDNWVTDIEPTFEADGHMNEICTACGETVSQKEILKLISGDANRDGAVNAIDLSLVRQMLLGKEAADEWQKKVVDANGDTSFDIRDLVWLKKETTKRF